MPIYTTIQYKWSWEGSLPFALNLATHEDFDGLWHNNGAEHHEIGQSGFFSWSNITQTLGQSTMFVDSVEWYV